MRYAVIGSGQVGSALATLFARAGIPVSIANTRGAESTAPLTESLGPGVRGLALSEALDSDVIILAVPFAAIPDVGKARPDWNGKTIVDATNPHYARGSADVLQGRLSAAYTAEQFPGADVVKAFNQLPAGTLSASLPRQLGRRVVFVASDVPEAAQRVGELIERLGLAPVQLGPIEQGGRLIEAPNALVLRNLIELPLR